MQSTPVILFDLDGTLTDPKAGITRSFQYALESMGQPVPSEDDLEWVIGPPLRASFVTLVGEQLADDGVRLYRERFGVTGLFENELIDGIPQLLEQLQADGKHMCVATSKPEVFAIRIVEHFGLSRFFGRVYGSELDGTRVDKRDLLPYVQQQEGFASHQAVMIGDRKHDVIGAKSIHVPTIGVRWGYGSDEELVAAGVHRLVDHPSEIATLVL
ncbi:MAG: HAD family hydrolase [Beijerinckiaceae bacterium]|jgi:phosphoglycolate phosphatase